MYALCNHHFNQDYITFPSPQNIPHASLQLLLPFWPLWNSSIDSTSFKLATNLKKILLGSRWNMSSDLIETAFLSSQLHSSHNLSFNFFFLYPIKAPLQFLSTQVSLQLTLNWGLRKHCHILLWDRYFFLFRN